MQSVVYLVVCLYLGWQGAVLAILNQSQTKLDPAVCIIIMRNKY